MKRIIVAKDSYYDSVFLMLINKELKKIPGVRDAVVSMGTEMNMELLREIQLFNLDVESATPNDLIIAVEGESEEVVENALRSAQDLLSKKRRSANEADEYRPVSLDTYIRMATESKLLIISVQ